MAPTPMATSPPPPSPSPTVSLVTPTMLGIYARHGRRGMRFCQDQCKNEVVSSYIGKCFARTRHQVLFARYHVASVNLDTSASIQHRNSNIHEHIAHKFTNYLIWKTSDASFIIIVARPCCTMDTLCLYARFRNVWCNAAGVTMLPNWVAIEATSF